MEPVREAIQGAIETGGHFELECQVRWPDGTEHGVDARGHVEKGASGQPLKMVGTHRDITARKEAEIQFHALADFIPQLAWIADPDGSIHGYNRRWYDYTGTTLEEMEEEGGWGWRKVHDVAELPRIMENFQKAVASGEPWEDTFRLRRRDGEIRWHLSRAQPVRDGNGRILRWFGTNTDIEEQRRQATHLRGALAARDTFLELASHDLRTPLTLLSLKLDKLSRSLSKPSPDLDSDRALQDVAVMRRQVKRLAGLIDSLLDASLAEGSPSLSTEPVDLTDVVASVLRGLEEAASRSATHLTVSFEGELRGLWDARRVGRVLENILSNALKWGVGKSVQVRVQGLESSVRLFIRDEGSGMGRDVLSRLFAKFERGVSERNYGGLGLGLYVARLDVDVMGGTLNVESEEGRGALFVVELPGRLLVNALALSP